MSGEDFPPSPLTLRAWWGREAHLTIYRLYFVARTHLLYSKDNSDLNKEPPLSACAFVERTTKVRTFLSRLLMRSLRLNRVRRT